ncbi:MAG TPA: 16S rRNA (adenine(1518)-N(6)/adenine(1519)-N(6))-dimethyltransferase RsmA [Candidatus Dormibacteraeota bacterium]|nr:16S rRNA (adenine(1518)-N(6)/adenine(1519)-N(6))-dimethyltransferase RsmA [Candidatus Dormibacteraeota bacterium]
MVATRARRPRLGQHFLVDPVLRRRVVEAAGIAPGDEVLEVGAGPGVLTGELVRRARRVVAVEVDRRLAARLRAAVPEAEVVNEDVLRLDLAHWFPSGGEVVVGNIPYYLTGALIRRLLGAAPRPRRLSLVVQREVARRWCGLDGWSLSTLVVQVFTRPRIELELPPTAFAPPPSVTSALVVMDVRPRPAVEVSDLDAFFRFAEAVFHFRRKQLRAALARALGLPAADAGALVRGAGIGPERRAETLTLAEWERLFETARGKDR